MRSRSKWFPGKQDVMGKEEANYRFTTGALLRELESGMVRVRDHLREMQKPECAQEPWLKTNVTARQKLTRATPHDVERREEQCQSSLQ